MHTHEAVNIVTNEVIPCAKINGKLYHHGGEGCEPVELGQQWRLVVDYSWIITCVFIGIALTIIVAMALNRIIAL